MYKPHVYYPRFLTSAPLTRMLDVPSAWTGIDRALACILQDFRRSRTGFAVEFGCDYGYSAAALSNFFDHLTTIDLFQSEEGDAQTGYRDPDHYDRVVTLLANFPVSVVRADFRDWIQTQPNYPQVDLVHADIIHEYQPTYEALRWAVQHSDLVLAHDTESFPDVHRACGDVAAESGYCFHNWPEHFGLGILSKEGPRD